VRIPQFAYLAAITFPLQLADCGFFTFLPSWDKIFDLTPMNAIWAAVFSFGTRQRTGTTTEGGAGCCLSCGELLPPENRYRCELCVAWS
jgi:hypothetical protein